ncbi:MAG: hypothetical protein Q8P12_00945 [bacterium]|nr:hypothetical protein [bacterium]
MSREEFVRALPLLAQGAIEEAKLEGGDQRRAVELLRERVDWLDEQNGKITLERPGLFEELVADLWDKVNPL